MNLEENIRQGKFESEHHKAATNILFTSSWLYNLNARRLKPHDITPEQFNVLRILRGSHPKALRIADISNRMIDRNSNATRLVDKLCKKGLTSRTICKSNRRQVDIHVTKKGLAVLSEIDKGTKAWDKMLKTISGDEAKVLNRVLDKLRG
jgi:DNA-binding MarR family transcriptional regulator